MVGKPNYDAIYSKIIYQKSLFTEEFDRFRYYFEERSEKQLLYVDF